MDTRDEALLTAAHFSPCGDDIWLYRKQHTSDEGDESETAVVVVKATPDGRYEGYIPRMDDPVKSGDVDGIPARGLRFSTSDVRDIVAMAVGENANVMSRIYGKTPDDIGFEDDGMWICAPFNGDPWGDYATKEYSPNDSYYQLEDPRTEFGELYTAWLDEYCVALLPATAPTPPSIGMARRFEGLQKFSFTPSRGWDCTRDQA